MFDDSVRDPDDHDDKWHKHKYIYWTVKSIGMGDNSTPTTVTRRLLNMVSRLIVPRSVNALISKMF